MNDPGKEKSVEEMMHQRIGDYDAFLEFQRLGLSRDGAIHRIGGSLDIRRHHRGLPLRAGNRETFSARVGGELGITRSDALECWVYQHALRHMGEIEHARALVGLTGMTS